jgi:hypothetical protein
VDLRDIPELVRDGQVGHSLVAVALYHFDLYQRANG